MHAAAYRTEAAFDQLRRRFSHRLRHDKPIHIVPYRGYGTPRRMHLKGRVLRDEGLHKATDHDTMWDNLHRMYRRFESDEIPGAWIRARLDGVIEETSTDEEGYFELLLEPSRPMSRHERWQEVKLELMNLQITREGGPVQATGHVMVPTQNCGFGIISDIDDTILQTQATNWLKMARLTFLRNARTRLPFEGVAAFYRALCRGANGTSENPIFYVSSSPWNLYDLLVDFMEVHNIPKGPLFLRDLGIDRNRFIKEGHHDHKYAAIRQLLTTYADLPFVLIGDSGQEDPEIYQKVAQDFPDRIRVIYIRDVSTEVSREAEVQAIARSTTEQVGARFFLAADSADAAAHAADHGLIDPKTLEEIRNERDADRQAPSAVEAMLDEAGPGSRKPSNPGG